MRRILIKPGILLSDYQQQEPLHQAVMAFFDQNAAQLLTSPICIAELNQRYADRPGDCADLTLVTLSERLNIAEILSLDSDFGYLSAFTP